MITDDDILDLASDWATKLHFTGQKCCSFTKYDLLTFARAIEAKEREACTMALQEEKKRWRSRGATNVIDFDLCIAAIRARG